MMIKVPRLAQGHGFKGPDFYGCCNTGTAPSIFHSRFGWVVGQECACREAMREGHHLADIRTYGSGRRTVHFYKTRGPAVRLFMAQCGARILENEAMRKEHRETARLAQQGDLSAVMRLGDY